MHTRTRLRYADLPSFAASVRHAAAAAYDQAGEDYMAYADGDAKRLFTFDGRYAYADRRVWATIRGKLATLRKSGARAVTILDAGCGPGTWLRRVVTQAHELGFARIAARGFDPAELQIRRARLLARDTAKLPGVDLIFETGDLTQPLPEADATVDISLCLYGVLNHIPAELLPKTIAEFARVTAGHLVATVRAIGSTPTIYVDGLEKARDFKQDNGRDRCEVELSDGRHIAFDSHLFSARELRSLVARGLDIDDLRGLDIFHGRFAPDRRWNPASLQASHHLYDELECLEETFATDPDFIDRAAHLLLVAHRRETPDRRSRKGSIEILRPHREGASKVPSVAR
jgi:SAM-dependent methyltransferase